MNAACGRDAVSGPAGGAPFVGAKLRSPASAGNHQKMWFFARLGRGADGNWGGSRLRGSFRVTEEGEEKTGGTLEKLRAAEKKLGGSEKIFGGSEFFFGGSENGAGPPRGPIPARRERKKFSSTRSAGGLGVEENRYALAYENVAREGPRRGVTVASARSGRDPTGGSECTS